MPALSIGYRLWRCTLVAIAALGLAGCSYFRLPSAGPSEKEIVATVRPGTAAVQVIDVDEPVARQLLARRGYTLFSDALGTQRAPASMIGRGDTLEVSIWEAQPATLFGSAAVDPRTPSTVRAVTLPEQMVDADGFITVPFAGRVKAAGLSAEAIQADIIRRFKGKANQPEVLVRLARNGSSNVTVVGDVANSVRMPLTSGGERLLDALAAAGGVRQPVNKMTLQVTRGTTYHALPLETVIRDPRQNVPLQPGDVITALYQSLSFIALGATGKNEEINFEAQGISLAQAIARSGGLQDNRSDARGVFIFRFEPRDALDWPRRPVATTPEGLVPVVYRIDLNDPNSFFVMQSFPVNNKDVLYVSNAPAADLQKFLNLVFSVAYPVLNTIQITK